MKYTKEEKLDIGRRIYDDEINRNTASEMYEISTNTAREYMRYYRDLNHLPPKNKKTVAAYADNTVIAPAMGMNELESMTKDELIRELIKVRINESRLKKGYQVKEDGVNKKYIPLDNRSIK